MPEDCALVFAVTGRGNDAVPPAALAEEHAVYGDILLLPEAQDGVDSKTFSLIATLSRLFGRRFRFYTKGDTDCFVLPVQYAQVLRTPPLQQHRYAYGGLQVQYGIRFMHGGLFFLSRDLAAVVLAECADCVRRQTNTLGAALKERTGLLPLPSPEAGQGRPLGYPEDYAMGEWLTSESSVRGALHTVRTNGYQTTKSELSAHHRNMLACFQAHYRDPARNRCKPPPTLALHAVKGDDEWALLAAFYNATGYDAEPAEAGGMFRRWQPLNGTDPPAGLFY